ncbi:hypothetical protein ACUY4R_001911 [Kosakonia sp. BK9b]
MSDIKEMLVEMKKAFAFGRDLLIPAYQEIQYITIHTEILFEDIDENLRILNKVIKNDLLLVEILFVAHVLVLMVFHIYLKVLLKLHSTNLIKRHTAISS